MENYILKPYSCSCSYSSTYKAVHRATHDEALLTSNRTCVVKEVAVVVVGILVIALIRYVIVS